MPNVIVILQAFSKTSRHLKNFLLVKLLCSVYRVLRTSHNSLEGFTVRFGQPLAQQMQLLYRFKGIFRNCTKIKPRLASEFPSFGNSLEFT